jgi:glycogen debranching enzyme
MLGYSVRAIWNATKDIEILKEFVPKLVKYYEWWDNVRDPDRDGLVSIIHPWESGIDASPLYDPAHGVRNPTFKQLYPKFIKLQLIYRRKFKWNQQKILEAGLFNMEDVGVCAVYADNWGVLAKLAENFDKELAAKCEKVSKKFQKAIIDKCWNEERSQFVSYYHLGSQEFCSTIETIQSLFPLILDDLPKAIAEKVVANLTNPDKFWLPYPIPSTPKSEETFNPSHFRLLWRGPTWPSTVWIVMEGLLKHGYESIAQQILDRWIEMYKYNGINEYHNPLTGTGEGEEGLGMSMMIIDMLHRLKRI